MIFMKNNDNENNVDAYDVVIKSKNLLGIGNDDVHIRKFMLLRLLKIIPELENKILHGRIKDKESEKIRLEYFKQYINICNCINNFTKNESFYVDKDVLKNYLADGVVDDFIVENPE